MTVFEIFWEGVKETTLLEWFAFVTGILYVIFAAKQKMICWLFALASSVSFVVLCVSFQLYLESILQVFFVVMAVVGWYSWKAQRKLPETNELLDASDAKEEGITTWRIEYHAINIIASGAFAFALGWIFEHFTEQKSPYVDAFTTVFSLVATFMVTRRVLENWVYWIVIDLVSIPLYASRSLYLSAVLYIIFTILAVYGFVAWYRKYKLQTR